MGYSLEEVQRIKEGAEQGNPEDICKLGDCYYDGCYVEKDYKEAFSCWFRAANMGFAVAQFKMGECHFFDYGVASCDVDMAFIWYNKAAEQGHPRAMLMVAYMYENGIGVVLNQEKGVYWYQKAAKEGVVEAILNLANCYSVGRGVEKNRQMAVELWHKASALGDSIAMYNLADAYQYGNGITPDINKAIEWYEKSSELGYLSSTYRLACFYYSGEGVVQDFDRAFSYYSKVAESDGSCKDLARLHLGKCYYLGRGIDCDYVKARELFEEAARNNDLEAMYYLGEVYRLGLGVAVNENISFSYYTKVVELWREYNDGSYIDEVLALSCFYAGCFCMNGRGTSRNMVEAVKYWKIGAEHNDKECQRNLAIAYKNGNGVPCNIELANYWFNIANK